MMQTRIVLADDHEIVREGLKSLLEKDPAYHVVGTAGDGHEAVRMVQSLQPDIAIIDVGMPLMNGIEATRKILHENPRVKVIALSMHEDLRFVSDVMKAGARGYLLKDCAYEELRDGLKAILGGSIALSKKINDMMIQDYLQVTGPGQTPVSALNPREREVLQLVAEGKKNKEIIDILHISIKTVETHRSNIMKKLNAKTIAELTRIAISEGII